MCSLAKTIRGSNKFFLFIRHTIEGHLFTQANVSIYRPDGREKTGITIFWEVRGFTGYRMLPAVVRRVCVCVDAVARSEEVNMWTVIMLRCW